MKLRCYLLSFLRIDHPDSEHCNARETSGEVMRKRPEELNWRTPPHSRTNGDREERIDSEPGEVITLPVSLKAQQGKKSA
jgi:hypothetical protein